MSVDTDKVDTVSGDDPHLKKEFGTVGLLFTAIG